MAAMVWDELPSSYDTVATAYDTVATAYDTVATAYEATFLDELDTKPEDQVALRRLASGTAGPVADVGCGPGQIGRFLRDLGRPVIGLDISAAMATLAAARLDGAMAADARHLPLGDASLGGVVAFYSLIHLRRAEFGPALGELHRVLRPGGRVLLAMHAGSGHIEQDEFLGHAVPFAATLYGLDELTGALGGRGFRVTASRLRAPYPSEHPTDRLYVEAERPASGA